MRSAIGSAPVVRRRVRRRTLGQSVVEFAIILPVFLLILAGIIDFGRLLHTRIMLVNASRDGARIASIMVEDPGNLGLYARNAAIAASGGYLSSSDADAVSVCWLNTALASAQDFDVCSPISGTSPLEPGDSVRVTVHTTYTPFFPVFPQFSVRDSIQMVLE